MNRGGRGKSGPVQMLLMCSGYDEIVLFISPVYFAGKGCVEMVSFLDSLWKNWE